MKKIIMTAVMAFMAIAAYAQIPAIKIENAKGGQFNTAKLTEAGVPTVISFWSTSCKPCIRELDAIYEAYPDWSDEVDFQMVAVSTDDSRMIAKARSLSEGHGWGEDFILLFDKNQDFMRAMNVSMVPHVFVLDAKGKVVFSHTSYIPGNEIEVLEAVKKAAENS